MMTAWERVVYCIRNLSSCGTECPEGSVELQNPCLTIYDSRKYRGGASDKHIRVDAIVRGRHCFS